MLPDRLTRIDETSRDQHHFLTADDRCFFFGDFYAGKGYSGGSTNQLITNFKRSPSEINASPKARQFLHYKNAAIGEVAAALRKVFAPAHVEPRTFVPLPSSKASDHPDYCDRLLRSLTSAFSGYNADIRPLLRQIQSVDADHRSGRNRIGFDDLLSITEIDRTQLQTSLRQQVVLFDDVLTSGKHFKVAQTRIHAMFPEQSIVGLFVARCIHASPLDEF